MTEPIAVFTADNHLRPTTWGECPELAGDAYYSLKQIVDYCREHALPLIQLGDLFDKAHPDSLSVGTYMYEIQRLHDRHIPFYYIEGNHDIADPPWASLHPWAIHAGKFTAEGVNFLGIDYCTGSDFPAVMSHHADAIASADVVLMHQAWAEIQTMGKHNATMSQMPAGCVLLTGDYHVTLSVGEKAANGEPITAYSPGSTSMQSLAESPEKVFGVLHSDLSVTWEKLKTRPFINAGKINTPAELDALITRMATPPIDCEELPQQYQKPILLVKYRDDIPDAYVRLVAAAGEQYYLFERPQRVGVTEVVDMQDSGTAFDGLVTAIEELKAGSPAVAATAIRLLQSHDQEKTLGEIENEYRQEYDSRHAETSG